MFKAILMAGPFVLQSPSLLISPLRLRGGPRPEDSPYPKSEEAATTTATNTATSDQIVDALLNEEGFLLDMDRSIAELEKRQEILVHDNHNQIIVTKEEQSNRQYKPFTQLAQKAAQLNVQYTNKIRDIRSSS